ncbi:Pectinesterase inhibitor 1 [Cardamine amara subsp. amara]|uniref:Pectinesterase inhibitor 1 n=1 Tax=Cardamine amara subsp. amara TaxID=228776 RepID=A0ABD1B6I8_CARAN
MAANLRNNAFLSSLMFLLLIGSSYAITSSEMSTICDKTLDPSFCLNFLNSKFSSPNIQALAKTTLDATKARATQTFKRLQSIIDGGVDPRSKLAYRSCLDEYEGAIGNIEEAFEHLASGDGMGMNMKVSAALDGADACLDDVKRLSSVDNAVVNNSKGIKNLCVMDTIVIFLFSDLGT